MGVRSHHKTESISVWREASSPIITPDVPVIDLDEAPGRYLVQIRIQCEGMGKDNRFIRGKQLILLRVSAVIDVVVEVQLYGFRGPLGSVHLRSDKETVRSYLSLITGEGLPGYVLQMITDAKYSRMPKSGDKRHGLLG